MATTLPTITTQQVADYIKAEMDFARFARLTKALGTQLNNAQLRFIKAMVFEMSMETYTKGKIKYIGEEGCDLLVLALANARVEMKYTEGALFTPARKELREETGKIKLMNSNGTNTHKVLPANYADYLIFIGNQGAMLFDKATFAPAVDSNGDGITASIETSKGILLAGPDIMTGDNQQEVDFINGLLKYMSTYIDSVK